MSATDKLTKHPEHVTNWILTVNGRNMPPDTDWKVESPFGSIAPRYVPDAGFSRPEYREARNSNLVVWGRDEVGNVKVGIIRQPRQHADDPLQPDSEAHEPVVFGQTVMGFIGKIFGIPIKGDETLDQAVARQVQEESGASVVLGITYPNYAFHNPNPSFVPTWSELAFVEVDLQRLESIRHDRSEPIFSAEFISVTELLRRIREGVDEEGAVYRSCTSNSVWLIWLSTHPTLLG